MTPLKLPALDPDAVAEVRGSGYPQPFKSRMGDRAKRRLGDACGLTKLGVNLVTLGPGGQSALRHWHTLEDEFVYVLEGEVHLVTDSGARQNRSRGGPRLRARRRIHLPACANGAMPTGRRGRASPG